MFVVDIDQRNLTHHFPQVAISKLHHQEYSIDLLAVDLVVVSHCSAGYSFVFQCLLGFLSEALKRNFLLNGRFFGAFRLGCPVN